jgi:hypothetical protein
MIYASPCHFVPATGRFGLTLLMGSLLLPVLGCGRGTPAVSPAATQAALPDIPQLCSRIDAALTHAREARRLDASVNGAWQVVHGILAFGPELPLVHDGKESAALDYLLGGGRLTGWILRPGTPGVIAVVEPGSTLGQGHPDQWLGYLSQCGVRTDGSGPAGLPLQTPLVVAGRDFTLADLLLRAKRDIRPGQEATWTLMALSAYEPDARWTASDGTPWTVERVVAMEADADIFTAACGGAHRLYGLAAALNAWQAGATRAASEPAAPDSGWAAAREVLDECLDRARRFQQPDGSFSTHFFERPGTSPDVFARLGATGHAFEVVALALPDERLTEPWVVRAADRLTTLLEQTADLDVECGALYHAAHGLALYRQRICPR